MKTVDLYSDDVEPGQEEVESGPTYVIGKIEVRGDKIPESLKKISHLI